MRRLFFIIVTLLAGNMAVSAQEEVYTSDGRQDPSTIWINKGTDKEEWRDNYRWHDPFDIYAGPVVGLVASNLTKLDGKYMFSPYVGGILQAYFNNHFGMSLEFAYTRQGTRDAWDNFHSDEEMMRPRTDENGNTTQVMAERGPYKYWLDYINTVYKLRYYPTYNFNVYAGFLFGVCFNAKCELDGRTTDLKGHLHARSAHIIGGVGYELDKLYFEGYYGFPISKLAKSNQAKIVLDNAKNNVFLLTVGYKFKLY